MKVISFMTAFCFSITGKGINKLVIRKVDDKPMVIHRTDDKKIDHHIKKKKDIREKPVTI